MEKSRLSRKWRTVGNTDNLAELSKLDEQIILDELRSRYEIDKIYTYVGDILIAVNPFKELPLYDRKVAVSYKSSQLHSNPPHIYAIVSHVYQCMLGIQYNTEPQDQCIVISGESGAGKTESTKFVVKQIIELCNGNTQLEQQILQVNPLLEAFGNAKTVINDNSSRFGKYIQLQFSSGSVVGAKISEYLLEKSRVVHQNTGDENFHIFSYMLAGCTPEQRDLYKLKHVSQYRYTKNNHKAIHDPSRLGAKFEELQNAMDLVGFSEEEQTNLMAIISGVLSVGNVDFHSKSDGECVSVMEGDDLNNAADLLGVEKEQLIECLSFLTNKTRGENILIHYNKHQAEDARDAVAKVIYGRVFSWIVNKINQRLAPQHRATEHLEIGILDIFGFENFQSNSFEQACINLANEHLQFFFNEHIFSLEQEEYKAEGIKWSHISYTDNQPLLDLFLKRPIGILALLDEESHFPQATNATFVRKLSDNLSSCAYYKSHKSVTKPSFTISHYAGDVTYDVKNWLEKNRDTIPPTLMSILKQSSNRLLAIIFKGNITRTGTLALQNRRRSSIARTKKPAVPSNTKKLTVGTQFKNSLQELIKHMSQAEPHFVRCLKPNNNQKADQFDERYVLSQLSYTGMLQTVEIRRDGYPLRPLIEDFISTYNILLHQSDVPIEANTCKQILSRAHVEDWHVGKTKVFLKYSHAEALTSHLTALTLATIKVQAVVRGFLARRYVVKVRELSHQQKLYIHDFLRAVADSSDESLVKQDNIIKQEKITQQQQLEQKRLEEEQEKKKLMEFERQKIREKSESKKSIPSSRLSSSGAIQNGAGLPPANTGSPNLNVTRREHKQPPRPDKPERLSALYGHVSESSEKVADPNTAVTASADEDSKVVRRQSRSQRDPLPSVPASVLPQAPKPPNQRSTHVNTSQSTLRQSQQLHRQSVLVHKQQLLQKQKSLVDAFNKFGYSSNDDMDDDVIEDDFTEAVQVQTNPYGTPGTRGATMRWFQQTQLPKLIKPHSNQLYDWFHGIIPRGKAEKMLLMREIGAFMIRLSEKRLGFVLSFRAETRCRHYMVDPTPSNKYAVVGEPKVHKTLAHLIDYHQQNSLSNWNGLLTVACGQMDINNLDYRDLISDTETLRVSSAAGDQATYSNNSEVTEKSATSRPADVPPLPPKLHSGNSRKGSPKYISYR